MTIATTPDTAKLQPAPDALNGGFKRGKPSAEQLDALQKELDALRDSVVRRLAASRAPESWIALVRDGGRLDDADQRRSFGEALPPGLRLIDVA
mgnify:CR=1 FL=1